MILQKKYGFFIVFLQKTVILIVIRKLITLKWGMVYESVHSKCVGDRAEKSWS